MLDPKKPFAVVFMNLGGPDTIQAIRPFLVNLFSDRQIIKLPMQPITARVIAYMRANKVARRYALIGGGSPILKLTREQAEKTVESLRGDGYECREYVGMNYWHPFIHESIKQAIADGFDQILGFSLFPHYSRTTTGACVRDLEDAVAATGKPIAVDIIDSWYDDEVYIQALAETVDAGLDRFTEVEKKDLKVIFTAHSLPQEFVDQGDPYPEHIRATIDGVLKLTAPMDWVLAYQSRSGPVKWLEPQTDGVIAELGESGRKNLLVVPVSFVSDHIETLFELDIMYRELAKAHGVTKYERAQALNSSPTFIKALTGIVERKLNPPH